MEDRLAVLFSRLGDKNLSAIEIKRLVKDVHYLTRDNKELNVATVNNNLVNLGWSEEILDPYTFELIIFVLDNEATQKRIH